MTDSSSTTGSGNGHPLLFVAASVIIIGGAKLAAAILVPFLLSLFIAIILLAPLKALTSKGVSHWLSVLIVLAVTLFFFGSIFIIVSTASAQFAVDLPTYQEKFNSLITNGAAWFDARGIDVTGSGLKGALNPDRLVGFFQKFVGDIGNTLSGILLILLTVIFMISDSALYSRKLSVYHRNRARTGRDLVNISELFESLSTYTKIMAAVSLLTGVLIWLGRWSMGVKYPVLWGVLIQPVWMGGEVGLSTLVVFLSMVFWGWLFGPTGMLLSVPLTITLKFHAVRRPHTLWLAVLLSNESGDTTVGATSNADS